MCVFFFFTYDELVRLSFYQMLAGASPSTSGRTELCNMLIVLLFFYCITGTVTEHTCIEEHIVFNYYQLHSKNISIGKGLNNYIYPFCFFIS